MVHGAEGRNPGGDPMHIIQAWWNAFTNELLLPVGLLAVVLLIALWIWSATMAEASRLRPDETVILFPTAAHLHPDGKAWVVPIHGWIFEREEGDRLHGSPCGNSTVR